MSTNYLVGSFELEYAGRPYHARYQSSEDEINQRLAAHEFIKVDGAYQEFMGSGADGYRFSLIFVGPNWRRDISDAIAHFRKNPKGLLVHPIHGRKRVGWKGLSPRVAPESAINAASMSVTFAEDNLDPAAGQPSTGSAAAGVATDKASQLTTATAGTSVTTRATVATLTAATIAYATAALAMTQGATPDPTLPSLLASVRNGTTATLAALASDSAALNTLATSRTLALETLAACYALDAVTQAQQPATETITLGGTVSLARLCGDRYGADAATMRDLILAMNRIPAPAFMPAGTVLRLPRATV